MAGDRTLPRSMLDAIGEGLDGAEHVYIAIRTTRGPHVTPELFTVSGGQILCLSAATTLKARVARGASPVGFAARAGTSSVIGVGTAEVLDPAAPSTVLRSPGLAAGAPAGLARFARDNAAELVGAAVDVLTGRLGTPIPPHRVILAITPTAVAHVDDDDLGEHLGWADSAGGVVPVDVPTAQKPVELSGIPPNLAGLACDGEGILGWWRSDGSPLALPARWDVDERIATVATSVFELAGAVSESAATITFDTWTQLGPTGKQGVMLRGAGRASVDGASTRIVLDVDRVTHWDGVETGTVESEA